MSMTRKQFLRSLAGSTMAVAIQGCGGGGSGYGGMTPSSSPAPASSCGSSGASISANHGHAVTLPQADLSSSTAMTYSIMGTATHDHTITLSVAQLTSLKTPGATVVVASTVTNVAGIGSHGHDVTVSCM